MTKNNQLEGKKIAVSLILLLGIILSMNLISATFDSSGFLYKQNITISNQTLESLQNYTITLSINLTSLINSGKVQLNCGDIRFINSANTQELPFTIISCSNISNSVFDIRLFDAGNGIYYGFMYYGNSTVISDQNENNTYLFYDSGSQDRSSEYTKESTNGITTLTYNSATKDYTVTKDAGGSLFGVVYPTGIIIENATITVIKKDDTSDYDGRLYIRGLDSGNSYYGYELSGTPKISEIISETEYPLIAGGNSYSAGQFYNQVIFTQGNIINFTVSNSSGTFVQLQTTSSDFSSGFGGIATYQGGSSTFKNLKIQKRILISPTYLLSSEMLNNVSIPPVIINPSTNPSYTSNSFYQIMDSAGSALAVFFSWLTISLPAFILLLAVFVFVIAILWIIVNLLSKWGGLVNWRMEMLR